MTAETVYEISSLFSAKAPSMAYQTYASHSRIDVLSDAGISNLDLKTRLCVSVT